MMTPSVLGAVQAAEKANLEAARARFRSQIADTSNSAQIVNETCFEYRRALVIASLYRGMTPPATSLVGLFAEAHRAENATDASASTESQATSEGGADLAATYEELFGVPIPPYWNEAPAGSSTHWAVSEHLPNPVPGIM